MKNVIVIIESLILAASALVLGSLCGNLVIDKVHLLPFIEDALANIIPDIMLILSQIMVLVLNYKKDWKHQTGLSVKGRIQDCFSIFFLSGGIVLLSYMILILSKIIFYDGSGFERFGVGTVFIFIVTMFIRMFIVGVSEELLFRAVIAGELVKKYGKIAAVIISTVIFTLFHCMVIQCWTQVTVIFITGMILGIIFIQTENILYPIFLHCGIDFFTNLVGMNEQVGIISISSFMTEIRIVEYLFGVMSVWGAAVIVFSCIFRKKSWY